jgi:small-conductance mechanosensitive channel/CRP-like cAMP-binding protein
MRVPVAVGRVITFLLILSLWVVIQRLDASLPGVLPTGTTVVGRILHAVLGGFVWLAMAWLLVQLLVRGFIDGVLTSLLRRRVPGLVRDLLRVLLYGGALVGVLAVVLDLPVGGVLATTGVVGVVLGFALRDMIADFFSGIAINLEEPYLIGETISLESGFIGRVTEISWRTTRLVSADEVVSVVPNGRIGQMEVRNHSRPAAPWRAQLEIVLGHEVPVGRALRILEAAVRGVDEGVNRLRGQAHVLKVDELGVHFVLFYWVDSIEAWSPLRTSILQAALDSLYHAGLQPVRPRSEVSLRRAMGGQLDERADRRMLLARVELFQDLGEMELACLAEPLRPLHVRPGQRVVTQGESGDSLYLVVEGLLEVRVTGADRQETVVGSLRAGDVFGEFSLMTGDPRSASVDTVTECRLLEVQRSNLEPILSGRPALARTLAGILAQRRLDARRTLERIGDTQRPHQALAERILRRVREVFSLHHVDQ